MSTSPASGSHTVGLLEVEPDLRAYLDSEECELVSRVSIPVQRFSAETLDIDAVLDEAGAFGAVILDGILLHRMSIGDQRALRLLGPGDVLSPSGRSRTTLLGHAGYRATSQLRVAIFDDRVLLIARRFPRVFAGLQVRLAEQHQRLAAQLVICQLPRVEDRLLALMWLLAESWGRVTARGTVLPIALTHDALGELIGARRPTVTLALKELAERGSLVRQDGEWLLLEPPPQSAPRGPVGPEPQLTRARPTRWREVIPVPQSQPSHAGRSEHAIEELVSALAELRNSHARSWGETRARLERTQRLRERTRSLRELIADQRLSSRRRAPARRPVP